MSSPTSVTVSVKGQQLHDDPIRARLLNKLGIYGAGIPADLSSSSSQLRHHSQSLQPVQTAAQLRRDRIMRGMGVGYRLKTLPPDGSAIRNPWQGVRTVTERLKVDNGFLPSFINGSSSTTSSPPNMVSQRKTRIAFQEDVEVMPIPTRYEYSDRIKSRIWSNRLELQENAERNAVEFASEGWNWRNVTEDDGMYICSQSGELVHPIHLKHLADEDQQQQQHHDQIDDADMEEEEKGGGLERGTPAHRG